MRAEGGIGKRRSLVIYQRPGAREGGGWWKWGPERVAVGPSSREGGWKKGRSGQEVYFYFYFFFNFYLFIRRFILR